MKRRNYKLFVEDIVDAMNKIERYIKDLTYETFIKNDMAVDAVVRNMEIIGEASKNLPEDVTADYPDIPWKRMIS